MTQPRSGKAGFILAVVCAALLGAAVVTTASLWWLGDWEGHRRGLTLALRIVWGVWVLVLLATALTRATIFGWYFRRYFRGPADGGAAPAPPIRPTRAPWYKSGKASFTITVVLVSLTGAFAVALAVMWVLRDVTGEWVFWLVFRILGATWWVLAIATVLTRVAIFGTHKKKAVRGAAPPPPPGPDAPRPAPTPSESVP